MGFCRLEENLIDLVKEQQAKLGFRPEVIRLYYPVSTLNHFFGSEDTAEKMKVRLNGLGAHMKETLGEVRVTVKGDRFCFLIPETGSVYVHEQMKGREFIQDLVDLVGTHGCSLEEIRELFRQWSSRCLRRSKMEISTGPSTLRMGFRTGIITALRTRAVI